MAEEAPRAYHHPNPDPAWLARLAEDILEPDLPIIDPHHHLWERPGNRYLLDDLIADTGSGHNIVATVFVQCGSAYRPSGPEVMQPVGETEFVAAIAAEAERRGTRTKICPAIVGHVNFRRGAAAVDPVLEAHLATAGGRFRGIRQIAAQHDGFLGSLLAAPPPHLLSDAKFRDGFARLAAYDLAFDAWVYHTQLGELTELARAFPAIPIVLDHVGGPLGVGPYRGRRDEVFRAWRRDIKALSGCRNVCVKLGGLAMAINGFDFHEAPLPPSSGELAGAWRPYIAACIEDFGAERCMFESNFPVDKGMCSYPVLWNAFKRLAAGASAAEKRALFHDTAARFYRIA